MPALFLYPAAEQIKICSTAVFQIRCGRHPTTFPVCRVRARQFFPKLRELIQTDCSAGCGGAQQFHRFTTGETESVAPDFNSQRFSHPQGIASALRELVPKLL